MYQYLESKLEEIIAIKQCKPCNKIALLIDQIIQADKELRNAGIDKALLSQYTSLQADYYRNLLGYAYMIGYRRAKVGVTNRNKLRKISHN